MKKIVEVERSTVNNEAREDTWVTLELNNEDYEWVEND